MQESGAELAGHPPVTSVAAVAESADFGSGFDFDSGFDFGSGFDSGSGSPAGAGEHEQICECGATTVSSAQYLALFALQNCWRPAMSQPLKFSLATLMMCVTTGPGSVAVSPEQLQSHVSPPGLPQTLFVAHQASSLALPAHRPVATHCELEEDPAAPVEPLELVPPVPLEAVEPLEGAEIAAAFMTLSL